MIHEEKLNGALNRFSSLSFISILHDSPLSAPSATYGIDYLSFPSVYFLIHFSSYRSFHLHAIPRFFSFFLCLPIRLSIYLFISLVCPSIYLSPILFSLASFATNHFIAIFLLLTTFLLDIAFRRFIKIFSPVSQAEFA